MRRTPRPAPCPPESPCGSSFVTTRDASDRLLPSHVPRTSTRASPVPVASGCFRISRTRGSSPDSRQCDSLRWAARDFRRDGRSLPASTRAIRTSGIPVASLPWTSLLAQRDTPTGSPRPFPARPRDRCGPENDPGCLPSCKLRCPATPSRAPGSGLPRGHGLATVIPAIAASFTTAGPLAGCRRWLRSPSTRPAANGRRASLDPSAACRLLQPETTRGHTLRALVPRTRVGLSPRYSPAPTDAGCVGRTTALPRRGPASRYPPHEGFHHRAPLARESRLRAGALERRRAARSWTISRVPFSWRSGHPGHRLGSDAKPGGLRPSPFRPRPSSDASPRRETPSRRPGCLLPREYSYATGGWLLRARPSRRPFTPPPWRHCSGDESRLFSPPTVPSSLTRKAPRKESTGRAKEGRNPAASPRRSASNGIYERIRSRADVPRTSWALSRTNRVVTQYKRHRNNAFFHPRIAHRAIHRFSPTKRVFPSISSRFNAVPGGGCLDCHARSNH
jgi:hypothetical protein